MRPIVLSVLCVALGCVLVGCPAEEAGCACTMEHRMNVCVTYNGSDTLPDAAVFLRERHNGTRDSLESFDPANCFGELPGRQRVLMLQNGSVVDSSQWFTLSTVDCCHGEAAIVNM